MNMSNILKSVYTKLALLAVMLFSGIASVSADNVLTVSTEEILPGETCTISVTLKNSDPVSGLNLDIILPDGMSCNHVQNAQGEMIPNLKIDASRVYNHTHMVNYFDLDNTLRVGIFPRASKPQYSAIKLNDGVIFTFVVNVHEKFNNGVIKFNNVAASDGTDPSGIAKEVTVKAESKLLLANAGTFTLAPNDTISLSHKNPTPITFSLNNTINVVALEAEVVLPENLTLAMNEYEEAMITLSDRTSPNAEILANDLGNGRWKLVLSSLTNDIFTGFKGELFTLNVIPTGDVEEGAALTMENVMVSNISNAFTVVAEEGADAVYFIDDAVIAYDKMIDQLAELDTALVAAVEFIAANYPAVKDQFTGEEIAAAIDSVQAEVEANVESVTKESNIDEFYAAATAAIEKMLADAKAAYMETLKLTAISQLSNNKLYHVSQPHHSKGATAWAIAQGGNALKSNVDVQAELSYADSCQWFAFITADEGNSYFLYHAAEKKFVAKDGSLTDGPVDPVKFQDGAFENTFFAFYDESHYVNVGGSQQMIIDGWSQADGGNSCMIIEVAEFDPAEALEAFVATGIQDVLNNTTSKDAVYDLQGRRHAIPAKGVFIRNGKKVIVK